MNAHWTERSIQDFTYRISSDFVLQLELKMGKTGISQSGLAEALGVTGGRVSQVLRNPGNLTLKKMVEYARSLGMKVSIVAYEDDDPENKNGPINSQIFNACWVRAGKPNDFYAVRESNNVVSVMPAINFVTEGAYVQWKATPDNLQLRELVVQDKSRTSGNYLIQMGAR
jgi:transcriptional regulator with XRE-family HTH domain